MGGLDELTERLSSARIELDDVLSEIESKADEVDFDPERLQWVNDRLSVIYSLEKKHQVSEISELLAIADDLRQRLSAIDNADARIAAAEAEVKRTFAVVLDLGAQLTAARQQAAGEMAENLTKGLQELGMPSVQIHFEFTARTRPDSSGCDAVRFLFTANKQMPLQDVAQTASGGEIARVMLTLKALIAQKRNLPTIIFDEIDTGVSGTMAERMGRVMQRMGQTAQVLCITHLPQIAALGTVHFWVHKQESDTGTTSNIRALSADERVQEIANMLSGAAITEAALTNARQLLDEGAQ
jgi:hypothetical protein